MRLLAISLTGRDPELVADRCWTAGAAGLWEVDDRTLRVGVDDGSLDGFLVATADLGPVDVTETEAVELAGRASTVAVAGHSVELWVPPTVFGDGHHPTTATCLRHLEASVHPGQRVLDVGCGAGALAIGAALLGARVTAIDLAPEAVDATLDNAARNGVALRADGRRLDIVEGPFDLVVANMTSGSLGPLVSDLVRVTTKDGTLVVSGMLENQWPAIRDAIGHEVVAVDVVDGWVTATVTGPASR